VHPTARYPHCTGAWRRRPPARDPHVSAAIPTVVTANPHETRTRRNRSNLHYRRRGADSNVDPRRRGRADGADAEDKAEQQAEYQTL